MADSTHLLLPYLEGAQAQKHVTVNESLRTLDALVLLAVEDKDLTAPPGSPAGGARYIPAATATGAWAGKEKHIAHYVDGAWQFHPPRKGFIACVRDEDLFYVYTGGAWAPLDTMLNADLKAIAQLSPANDDVLQRKSGAWTNRTIAQLLGDLGLSAQSWSPTLTTSGTDFSSVTYHSVRTGGYVKAGNLVAFWGRCITDAITVGSASGSVQIGGLPFTPSSSFGHFAATIGYASSWGADRNPTGAFVLSGSARIPLFYRSSMGGSDLNVTASDVNTGAAGNDIIFSGLYTI